MLRAQHARIRVYMEVNIWQNKRRRCLSFLGSSFKAPKPEFRVFQPLNIWQINSFHRIASPQTAPPHAHAPAFLQEMAMTCRFFAQPHSASDEKNESIQLTSPQSGPLNDGPKNVPRITHLPRKSGNPRHTFCNHDSKVN